MSDQELEADPNVISNKFARVLPSSRTGKRLTSLQSFQNNLGSFNNKKTKNNGSSVAVKVKEYALVVVTEQSTGRILLGLKHRGFGKGMYNSFGGKKEISETIQECACRELQEETGIVIPLQVMTRCFVGSMNYTFHDQNGYLMLAHMFHINVNVVQRDTTQQQQQQQQQQEQQQQQQQQDEDETCRSDEDSDSFPIDPQCIRGCDEITPKWFDSYWDIPLDNMFADDSLWLTQYLLAYSTAQQRRLSINGWFHFLEGGQQVNSIYYYYLDIRHNATTMKSPSSKPADTDTTRSITQYPPPAPPHEKFSLEKRLFHTLCCDNRYNTTVKEFKEAWAFTNAVKSVVLKKPQPNLQVIIDVAGGHGALAALLLITTTAQRAVVIDPAKVGSGAVEMAWRKDFLKEKRLDYRYEDLRTGLPSELSNILRQSAAGGVIDPSQILVVACHACQHLSEEVLHIVTCQYPGVHVAVMPCCQRDTSKGCSWKNTSKNLQIPIEKVMDLLLAGKIMNWQVGQSTPYEYEIRMKVIDHKITPQNRIIICKANKNGEQQQDGSATRSKDVEAAHRKLALTYAKAHGVLVQKSEAAIRLGSIKRWIHSLELSSFHVGAACGVIGFAVGVWVGSSSSRGDHQLLSHHH